MNVRLTTIATTLFSSIALLSGCTTGVVHPAKGTPTMKQSYYGAMQNNDHVVNTDEDNGGLTGGQTDGQGGQFKVIKRNQITLPSQAGALQSPQLLKQQAQNTHEFPLLPNPQLTLYIYPHFEGAGQMPVHGNWTTFPMYTSNHYALPSEVQTVGGTL